MTSARIGQRADSLDLTVRSVALPSAATSYIDEGRGRPILLLHGAPLTSLGFVNLIEDLRPHCRVLAPDFPGFGCSVERPDFDHTLRAYAAFVVEFCEALDLRDVTIFVNDTSGPIGLSAASQLGANVVGLVVADTMPIPLVGRAVIVRLVLRRVVGSRAARWLNRRANLLPWLVALGSDRNFLEETAEGARAHLSQTPALLLYGQFDPMRFVGAPGKFRQIFEQAETVIIPREEPFPILGSAPQVAAAILGWWRRVSAADEKLASRALEAHRAARHD